MNNFFNIFAKFDDKYWFYKLKESEKHEWSSTSSTNYEKGMKLLKENAQKQEITSTIGKLWNQKRNVSYTK
ncbi:hypothetical protein ACT7DB_34145 [Bacillus cereus]